MGHCLSYNKTCEIETAMAESTIICSREKNSLPVLPARDETVLTYFWVDNFDMKVEYRKGNGSIHTTHLMAFQESSEGVQNNTNFDINLPRSKRRKVSSDPEIDAPFPIIDKNQEPPKFHEIIKSSYSPTEFPVLYLLWLCFRKWNSYDQTVPTFSGWLLNVRKKRSRNQNLTKTTETYLPPMLL